ncbi:MAG: calcium-translocating P-type ATPase, PMCA-type [Candidatus Altiarchaeota archaeon]
MQNPAWHSIERTQVLEELASSETGLTSEQARERQGKYGLNQLMEAEKTSILEHISNQFKDFLIILLIIAAVISIGIGILENSVQEMVEAGLILLIVLFIVIVGFYQEYNAEKELEALKKLMTPSALTLRDGVKSKIDASGLVPGDIVFLESGDRIPADLRVIQEVELRVDESSLTGESNPVEKKHGPVSEDSSLADRSNMLYMSTTVVYGKATAVVVSTGMGTEIGRIAGSIQDIKEEKTPLQERLSVLGKQIGVGVIIICAIVLVSGILASDTSFLEMAIVAIALAVAAVPEGLPGVVTVALAGGTRRMVKENVIIRKLPAVETLGSTTVICTDKTGTLTKNEMTVKKIWLHGRTINVQGEGYSVKGRLVDENGSDVKEADQELDKLLTAGVLANDAGIGGDSITGDPTAASVLVAAAKIGYSQEKLNEKHKRVDEITFSSERKRFTTINEFEGVKTAYTIGAPDVVLDKCNRMLSRVGETELSSELRTEVLEKNSEFATQAYRVLGLAFRQITGDYTHENLEQDMTFIGLVAMIDPPREESAKSVDLCKQAGIRVVMITGDHKLTAKAIAKQVGIYHEGDQILTGAELEKISDAELENIVERTSIYARVSPIHKLKIVKALQARGNVVAMTGDGVNDAPALKKADIGVAMGITGTDVSKEASDMVLTDDNFSSIVRAVEEGRGIYDNIRKFFAYLISGNIGEVAVVFLSSIIPSVPIALTASQILIVNLVTDGLPALALGVDPFEPGAMKRKPRPRTEPLHKDLSPFILWYPVLMILVTMSMFLWVYDPVEENVFEAQTVAFLCIAFFEMYQAFASRSTRYPAFKVGLFKNKWLLAAVGFSLLVVVGLLYVPLTIPFAGISIQDLTHTYPLSAGLFLSILGLSSLGFIYLEIQKWWNTRGVDLSTS